MESFLRKLFYLGIAFYILVPSNSAFCSMVELTVNNNPSLGGRTDSNDGKIHCPETCSATYYLGGHSLLQHTPVTVRLTATANECYRFSHWSGDLTGSENPKNITFSNDKSVTANFVSIAGTLSISDPMATPEQVPADGSSQTTLTVRVTSESEEPPSVSVNLSDLGGSSAQTMYDDGTNGGDAVAGDGIYTVQTTVRASTSLTMKGLQVSASDECNTATAIIKVFATKVFRGTAPAGGTKSHQVNNTIDGQTLKVNHNLQGGAPQIMENGETTLAVRNPVGQVVATETMSSTTSTIRIENAAAGNYTYEVENQGTTSQAYQIETVTGGVGIIVGTVTDAVAGTNLTGIRMSTDTGGTAITLEGNYVMVAVAGVLTVSAVSLGFEREDQTDVTVNSGETVTVDLVLTPLAIPFNVRGITTDLLGPPNVGTNVQVTILVTRSQSNLHYRWLWNTVPFAAWQTLADWALFNDNEPWSPDAENRFVVLAHAAEIGETTDFHQGGLLLETAGNSANAIQILDFAADLDYPQQTGTPITLTATAGEGSGTIYFKFLYRLNFGGWTEAGDWTEDGEETWTPQQAGFYTIVVHVSDDNTIASNPLNQAGMTFVIED
jgi:hypothetical protein